MSKWDKQNARQRERYQTDGAFKQERLKHGQESARKRAAERRERARRLHICVRCESPCVEGQLRCEQHLAKDREYQRRRSNSGFCVSCGAVCTRPSSNPNRKVKKHCLPCGVRFRIRYMDLPLSEKLRAGEAWDKFDGKCQGCGNPEPAHQHDWHIDHCHETKTFRGILCGQCNAALGMVKDSIKTLEGLIGYLQRTKD